LRGAWLSTAVRPRAHPPSRSTPPWPSDHGRLGGVNLEGSVVSTARTAWSPSSLLAALAAGVQAFRNGPDFPLIPAHVPLCYRCETMGRPRQRHLNRASRPQLTASSAARQSASSGTARKLAPRSALSRADGPPDVKRDDPALAVQLEEALAT